MNTFSHIKITRLLYMYLKDKCQIRLNYFAFVIGSISPDFSVGVITNPHYIDNHFSSVQSQINSVCGNSEEAIDTSNFIVSQKIGRICHFYSDFFCFVHNKEFEGTSMEHVNYESKLHKHLVKEFDSTECFDDFFKSDNENNVSEINCLIMEMHNDFSLMTPTFERDIKFSITACLHAVTAISKSVSEKNIFASNDIAILPI